MKNLTRKPRKRNSSKNSAVPLTLRVIAGVALFILLAPMVVVILAGLNSGDHLSFPPEGLSFRWIIAFFKSDIFLPAYGYSLMVAVITMVFSTIIGTTISLFLVRTNFRGKQVAQAFFMSPLMLPGIVIGLALYLFYISADIGLNRTLAGLIIGHVIVTCPYVIGTVSAALSGFDISLEEASRSLGASPWQTFRKITLPVITPGIIAGATFAFIVSFGQFDVSLFLAPPGATPLPMALYVSLRYTFEPTAAAAGIFAIFLVAVSTFFAARMANLKRMANANFPDPK